MRFLIGFVACVSLVIPGAAFGQMVGATTGAINGKVVDPSDAVLPGVTVTISAPQMQGEQTAVTNADGNYRFPGIPPGTYRVSYELPGFAQVVREGIRVTLGFTATLNVTLQVSTLQETVTVTGVTPVVDVSSTKTSTNYDYKELASIPSARDMWAILAESPAVTMARIDVGGSAAGTQSGYRTYDARGGQNRVMIDGLVTTEGTDAIGVYVDYGAFEEVDGRHRGTRRRHGPARRADADDDQVRREPVPRLGLRRLPELGLAIDQHHRRTGLARDPRQGSQPDEGLLRLQRRRRRLRQQGQDLVVRLVPRVRHRNQRATLPGAGAPDQAAPLQRQDDVLAPWEQQGHRLADADPENPADATRRDPPQQSDQPHRRIDAESAALGLGLQGRMEQGAERLDVHRAPRRPVRLQLAARPERECDRAAHPGLDNPRGDRPEPAPPAESPPQPGAGLPQLLQGRPRRQPRLQIRRRGVPRDALRGVLPDLLRQPDHLLQAQ